MGWVNLQVPCVEWFDRRSSDIARGGGKCKLALQPAKPAPLHPDQYMNFYSNNRYIYLDSARNGLVHFLVLSS